jgi:hypothetical protein
LLPILCHQLLLIDVENRIGLGVSDFLQVLSSKLDSIWFPSLGTVVDGWSSDDDEDGLDFDHSQHLWSAVDHEIVVVEQSESTAAGVSMVSIGTVRKYSFNHEIVVVEQSESTAAGVSMVSIGTVRKYSFNHEVVIVEQSGSIALGVCMVSICA